MVKFRYKKRLLALTMAGMLLLSGCGKNDKKDAETTSERVKSEISVTEDQKEETQEKMEEKDTPAAEYLSAPAGKTNIMGEDLIKGEVTDPTEEERQEFIDATADFSFNVMKALLKESNGDNVMISPDSIISALAMTENGADGKTLEEMMKLLGGNLSLTAYNEALSSYNTMLEGDEGVKFHNANSIWVRNDERLKVNKDFVQTNKDYYDASLYVADFDNKTIDDINAWVDENTNKMINKVVDRIPDDAMLYLINAVAFEGAWSEQYDDSQIKEGEKFTNLKGEKEEAVFLTSLEHGYFELNGGLGFVKPYRSGIYEFVAILPPEGMSADEYLTNIEGKDFVKAYNDRDYRADVHAKLPEFSYDYDTSLKNVLIESGMATAFSDAADFGKMADKDLMPLKIGDVIHKTHIELDRNGTKAAAVTSVEMQVNGILPEEKTIVDITLDRSFAYAIVDTETGLPVFLGTVNTVAK
ncbi:MAG: proteinase inhibitor I4 serpin [Eubacterium sp.]|nr:proteinase inhibitor I4 serpin [Eubacterium sp.]